MGYPDGANDPERPQYKLYSDGAVFGACFLGGPMGGFFLIGLNGQRLGDERALTRSVIYGAISTFVLLFIAMHLPDRAPGGSAIPLAYSLALRQYAAGLFGNAIAKHVSLGGQMASGWKAAGVGLLAMIFTLVVAVGLAFALT